MFKLILILLSFIGEPTLLTDTAQVQIYRFADRTVVVIPNGVNYHLTFPQPVELAVVGTTDATVFFRLAGSGVFHTPDCRFVKDRPDALRLTPEQCLLLRPCSFCKPTEF